MPYNPGVENRAGEYIARGITGGIEALTRGWQDGQRKKEEQKIFESRAKATEGLLKSYLPKEQADEVLKVDPNETPLARYHRLTGTIENFVVENKLKEYKQQQKDNDALNALFGLYSQTGDVRQGLAAYSQAGGSPQGLQAVDSMLSRMSAPQKPQMQFRSMEEVEAKFPSSKWDYKALQGPDGSITIEGGVSPRAPAETKFSQVIKGDTIETYDSSGRLVATAPRSELPADQRRTPDGGIEAIPGGKSAKEEADKAAAAKVEAETAASRGALVVSTIDEVIPNVNALTAGPIGAMLGGVPGTPAYDIGAAVDTIKANIGFEQLQEMRKASPTGGALGQVAVKELEFLQAARANLDRKQSPEQLKKNLFKIRHHFDRWKLAVSGVNPDTFDAEEQPKKAAPEIRYDKQGRAWTKDANGNVVPYNG